MKLMNDIIEIIIIISLIVVLGIFIYELFMHYDGLLFRISAIIGIVIALAFHISDYVTERRYRDIDTKKTEEG